MSLESLPPIAVVSIPKAGTHLLIHFLELLGYRRGGCLGMNPVEGHWYQLSESHTHTITGWLGTIEPYHPVTKIPVLFMYRNPLDMLVSEASYVSVDGNTAFWSYFANMTLAESIYCLIDDLWMLSSIRQRVASYIGWMNIGNVIAVSFEELVGQPGGGNDEVQAKAIESICLKLGIRVPYDLGKRIFNENSPTFRKGKIGSHRSAFDEKCYRRFAGLDQDFMQFMGYKSVTVSEDGQIIEATDEELYSSRINEFRDRPLILSTAENCEMPYLVASDVFDYNVVLFRKRYYAARRAMGDVDFRTLSEEDLAAMPSSENLDSLRHILEGIIAAATSEETMAKLNEAKPAFFAQHGHNIKLFMMRKFCCYF